MSMFFIARKKLQYEYMSHFEQLPEFQKEFKRLSKKYRSLQKDLDDLEDVLKTLPTGSGKNFTIIHSSSTVKIIKTRLACESLRDRSIRLIYAYFDDVVTFVHIEIYFKADEENEDVARWRNFVKSVEKKMQGK